MPGPVHEPTEEAEASFAPLFQLAPEFDSEPAGRSDFCTRLKNGICAVYTSLVQTVLHLGQKTYRNMN